MRFVILLAVVVLGTKGDDECMPPKPGEKHAHPTECCKLDGVGGSFVETLKTGVQKCQGKFPPPPRPGPPPAGAPPTPSPAMKKHHTCMAECVFTEAGLVKDNKLDKAAISKSFTSDNQELTAAITAAIDKCFSSYEKDIDTSLECKSGAAELEKCVNREIFLSCPASLWTSSAECTALKTKVTKCPQMPMMMMGPPGHHGPPPGPRPN